jgi:hypothetical protein
MANMSFRSADSLRSLSLFWLVTDWDDGDGGSDGGGSDDGGGPPPQPAPATHKVLQRTRVEPKQGKKFSCLIMVRWVVQRCVVLTYT